MIDPQRLDLPEFRQWSEQFVPPGDENDFVIRHVSVTAAYLLAETLFFPQLIQVRGCVLIANRYDPTNFDDWWQEFDGDTAAVEKMINHLHLWDAFDPDGDAEHQAVAALADRVAQSWRAHAAAEFPDRTFTVDVVDDYGPTVCLSSRPQANSAVSPVDVS